MVNPKSRRSKNKLRKRKVSNHLTICENLLTTPSKQCYHSQGTELGSLKQRSSLDPHLGFGFAKPSRGGRARDPFWHKHKSYLRLISSLLLLPWLLSPYLYLLLAGPADL